MIFSIAHPTDLSPQGTASFEHALSLALVNRCRLDVLHVDEPGGPNGWADFPQVRQTLQRWGVLPPGAPIDAVRETTGVEVRKVGIHDHDPVEGMARFLEEHPSNLIVMSSHGRAGIERLLSSSVSAGLVQTVRVPTLILGPAARPFIDPANGRLAIGKILVPVDHEPAPHDAIVLLEQIAENLNATLDFVHVGTVAPALGDGRSGPRHVRTLGGPVLETLLAEAQEATVVAMPMAGARGLVDALKGSTTEQLVREVSCPVLALPVAR
jgi:nucleotide-binding universal stress UspA family protein